VTAPTGDAIGVCLAGAPAIVSNGQAFVIGTGLLLGLLGLLTYRLRTRRNRYQLHDQGEEL
jgi:hypothetical protein